MKIMKRVKESVAIKVGASGLLANGVEYSIDNVQTLYGFFEQLYHRDWNINATVFMRMDGEEFLYLQWRDAGYTSPSRFYWKGVDFQFIG